MTKFKFIVVLVSVSIIISFNHSRAENKYDYIWDFKVENDEVYYFWKGEKKEKIEDVDITTFERLSNVWAKDKNSVFFNATAGPYSSKFVSHWEWAHSNKENSEDYEKIDIESFEIVEFPESIKPDYYIGNLAKDKNHLYRIDCANFDACYIGIFDNITIDGFQYLGSNYVKDKNGIYYVSYGFAGFGSIYTESRIDGADEDTFEVLKEDEIYAMDKNNMYLAGRKLTEAGEIIQNESLYDGLKGKILLKVESSGEAYYVHPTKKEMHFLSRPVVAFHVMRKQGVGITNDNLEKIEIALGDLSGVDADNDGLPDMIEDSIGTDKNIADTDGDGYSDKDELQSGYNPKGEGKINIDNSFSINQKGKIFLQVEKNGEAWYVNPIDNKRYFLGRPTDAFSVMRTLGLGISNMNYEKLKGN